MHQIKAHFKDFRKLVIYHSCRFQRWRQMISNVQSRYRKITQGTFVKFCKFISLAFFEPVLVALLLRETAVIGPVWVMIQLEAFLTPLCAALKSLIFYCGGYLLSRCYRAKLLERCQLADSIKVWRSERWYRRNSTKY